MESTATRDYGSRFRRPPVETAVLGRVSFGTREDEALLEGATTVVGLSDSTNYEWSRRCCPLPPPDGALHWQWVSAIAPSDGFGPARAFIK